MNIKHTIAKHLHRIAASLEKDNNLKPIISDTELDKTTNCYTDCSYEATWYMTQGARFEKVRDKELSKHQQEKRGYKAQWTIYLTNVPERSIKVFKEDRAQIKVGVFKRERQRLKRYIKSFLDEKNGKKRDKKYLGY